MTRALSATCMHGESCELLHRYNGSPPAPYQAVNGTLLSCCLLAQLCNLNLQRLLFCSQVGDQGTHLAILALKSIHGDHPSTQLMDAFLLPAELCRQLLAITEEVGHALRRVAKALVQALVLGAD